MTKLNAKVMVATPTYTGDVVSDYALCLCFAGIHCLQRRILLDPRFAPGFSLVEYGRNWLVAEFLASDDTHLFWIDADLFFDPKSIARMIERNVDVIAGVYTTKHETAPVFPYLALGPAVDGVQTAERVPGGFLCMSRRAVEKVVESCDWHEIDHNGEKRRSPRFFDLRLDGDKLVGEDFIACERLRKAGFKIHVETDITFKHYGRKAWTDNLARVLAEEAATGFSGQGTSTAWKNNASLEPHERDES
jgi:hypothetical protein